MDATADAIFLVNRTTMRFIEVNASACNMLGYSREELLQAGPAQLPDNALDPRPANDRIGDRSADPFFVEDALHREANQRAAMFGNQGR